MDSRSSRGSDTLDHELIEGPSPAVRGAAPELHMIPVPPLCSPIMEHRPIVPLPPDADRLLVALPPARDPIRPMSWAVVLAIPVLAIVGWQAAVIVGLTGAIIREVDARVARANFTFADGFLGFHRELERAQGVQEDDDVRWNWSHAGSGHARG